MKFWQRSSLVLFPLVALACGESGGDTGGGDTGGDATDANGTTGDVAGGTTTDFTGSADAEVCTTEREEREGDEPALGFSLAELLAASAGDFEIPIRWENGCALPGREGLPVCQDNLAGFHALDGRDTIVRVSITYGGEPALVRHPTEEQPICAQSMLVDVSAHITSADGLLDETIEARMGSECGDQVGIGFDRPIRELTGGLSDPALGFSDDFHVDFSAGFFEDRMWLDLHVASTLPASAFTIDLPPFGEQTHDVPRSLVELQLGAPMPSGHCENITY